MTFRHSLLAASMGLALLQVGCSADVGVNEIGGLGFGTLDSPAGSDPGNGLDPVAAMNNMSDLLEAMDKGLYDPTNDAVATLASTYDGFMTLWYAADCALPPDSPPFAGSEKPIGDGILTTTSGWATGALSTSQKEDVLTCLVARFNGLGAHVSILMTGDHVDGTTTSGAYYNTEEAFWVAELSATNEVTFYAWPLNDLVTYCGPHTVSGVGTRTCGTALGTTCFVDVRATVATDCEDLDEDGHYTCLGRPAIKTWLNTEDVVAAYRTCGSP